MGLPGQAVGVAQARGEQAFAAAGALDLPDRGTAFLYFHAIFADVAVGADGDVQVLAVGAGDDVLGPVVIEARRQFGDYAGRRRDLGLPAAIGKAQQAIGIGDVEVIADQGHAERRVQVVQKHRAQVDHAVMVAVAQQGDAVGAGHAGTGAGHDLAGNPALKAETAVGGGRIAFRHQHIAIG